MVHIEDGNASKQFICSDIKKNIFLIGDSIRLGYCDATREALSNMAEVFFVPENCRNTQYVITCLNGWANMFSDRTCVDIVQFNCGHWDVARWCGGEFPLTSEDEYKKNLQIIIDMISVLFPNAKKIFATTTTMNPNGQKALNDRTNSDIERYNDIAKGVMIKNNIEINDLFAITKEWDSSYYGDYCHFTAEANRILGEYVANTLELYF
ncbi:MAG: SGNH/GDSL hydrolase family protein [Lachnospiraceae bacterium]|nr:SGNH/GDSL hydrolase family protein [Lachnospiraceae bacterium]